MYSAIHFFYPSFSYTVIKNHPQRLVKWLSMSVVYIGFSYTILVFLMFVSFYVEPGDVGSNMSLYLGASFVTLLEFIVLVLRCARFAFQN